MFRIRLMTFQCLLLAVVLAFTVTVSRAGVINFDDRPTGTSAAVVAPGTGYANGITVLGQAALRRRKTCR